MTVVSLDPPIIDVPAVLPLLVDQRAATDAVATEAGIVLRAVRNCDLRQANLELAKQVLGHLRAA